MKLKKIASLMLAGVMAISMLTACGDKGSSSSEGTVVTPVDNSFAAAVNAELTDKQKELITFGSSDELASALDKIVSSTEFTRVNTAGWVTGGVVTAFRELLDADDGWDGDTFTQPNGDKVTSADMILVPGALTDKGLAEYIADEIGQYIDTGYLPVSKTNATYPATKEWRSDYTADIAVTEITNVNDQYSFYVVAFTITQTNTEVNK